MVKVIMTWDIQDDQEQAYIDFAINELNPTLGVLGLQISDVWYTVVGGGPEMVVSGLMPNRADAVGLIRSRDWQRLRQKLEQFVENVRVRVIEPQKPFEF